MYIVRIILLCLLYLPTISASWSGIAVVGQNGQNGQIYEPQIDAYYKTDNFGFDKQCSFAATTAVNCKVYTSGGNCNRQASNTVVEADARTDNRRNLARMTIGRYGHSMTSIDSDTLVICGGTQTTQTLNTCELCHIAHPVCVPTANMPSNVDRHVSVVSNGHLYVIGGNVNRQISAEMLDYQVSTNSWRFRAPMRSKRGDIPGAVALSNGNILVCGGSVNATHVLNTCESYDPLIDSWTNRGNMQRQRHGFSMVRWNGRIYAIGGMGADDGVGNAESYNEQYDQWSMEDVDLLQATLFNAVGAIDRSCVS